LVILDILGLRSVSSFLISGLPKKEPQHPLVKDGCPKSWVLFMGLVYTFTYLTTATGQKRGRVDGGS
jgi:hypothetical protein